MTTSLLLLEAALSISDGSVTWNCCVSQWGTTGIWMQHYFIVLGCTYIKPSRYKQHNTPNHCGSKKVPSYIFMSSTRVVPSYSALGSISSLAEAHVLHGSKSSSRHSSSSFQGSPTHVLILPDNSGLWEYLSFFSSPQSFLLIPQ